MQAQALGRFEDRGFLGLEIEWVRALRGGGHEYCQRQPETRLNLAV